MMKTLLSLLALSPLLFAAEPPQTSEFQLEKGLVDKLYQESVNEGARTSLHTSAAISISPLFSLFKPSALTLSNDYFEVPYARDFGSLPSVSVLGSGRLASWGGLQILGIGSVGYSMKEAVQSVNSKTGEGDSVRTARVTLHWLPISIGSRVEYRIDGFETARPYLLAKAGAEWFYQVGGLDGLEQGFWVPFYQYGGGLTLFDSGPSPDKWFGGVNLGISKHQSFSSNQKVEGTVFELGLNILL